MKRNPPPNNVRRVRSTGVNNVGHQIGINGEIVQTESMSLERLHFLHLLRDPSITKITSQPITIQYLDENLKIRKYTPDFFVTFSNKNPELHECTLQFRRKKENIIRREIAGKAYCQEKKWDYIIITPQNYPCKTTNANILNISNFRFKQFENILVKNFAYELLNKNCSMPFIVITKIISEKHNLSEGTCNMILFHHIWKNNLLMDWSIPIFTLGKINKAIYLTLPKRENDEKY